MHSRLPGYCFALRTHADLDLDSGRGFDGEIVATVDAGALVRREPARWSGEPVAMGTDTDPQLPHRGGAGRGAGA